MLKSKGNEEQKTYPKLAVFERTVSFELVIYDLILKRKQRFPLPPGQTNNCDVIQVNNLAYITGGGMRTAPALPSTFVLNLDTLHLEQKHDMLFAKYCHNSALVMNTWIYSVGGKTTLNSLDITEKYSIQNDAWKLMKPLNERKYCVGISTFNERYIYTFGGMLDEGKSRIIERFDACDEENGWKIIEYEAIGCEFTTRGGGGVIQRTDTTVLIFGGRANLDTDEVFEFFGPRRKIWQTPERLKRKSSFYCTKSMVRGRKVTTVDFTCGSIHEYDLWRHEWTMYDVSPYIGTELSIQIVGVQHV
eukprot:TRINITY_DN16482_c0_g1_i2.p1 TRINITY_DN16482_c0_g1~~TRINITY_DN16482_c0_g1_i2.p1  ORF type:complete len:330 (-),score=7.43 TRINITY_DN16482_c0_g1_i2:64-975(-)